MARGQNYMTWPEAEVKVHGRWPSATIPLTARILQGLGVCRLRERSSPTTRPGRFFLVVRACAATLLENAATLFGIHGHHIICDHGHTLGFSRVRDIRL